jgi:hypothetical protein
VALTPLCELALKHGTDKYAKHFYTPVYYDLFKDRADTVNTVMEIGIGDNDGDSRRRHAGSLRMWEAFFPNAKIIGVDKHKHLLLDEGRIVSFYADQREDATMKRVACEIGGTFDIIIDDGSHQPYHQIASVKTLLPFVSKGGFYIIEDIRTDFVFDEVRKFIPCERVHTNQDYADSVLGIIRK